MLYLCLGLLRQAWVDQPALGAPRPPILLCCKLQGNECKWVYLFCTKVTTFKSLTPYEVPQWHLMHRFVLRYFLTPRFVVSNHIPSGLSSSSNKLKCLTTLGITYKSISLYLIQQILPHKTVSLMFMYDCNSCYCDLISIDLSVGQSPPFYIFDTPWFLIPHSFTDRQPHSHFQLWYECNKCTSVETPYWCTIKSKDIHKPNTIFIDQSIYSLL